MNAHTLRRRLRAALMPRGPGEPELLDDRQGRRTSGARTVCSPLLPITPEELGIPAPLTPWPHRDLHVITPLGTCVTTRAGGITWDVPVPDNAVTMRSSGFGTGTRHVHVSGAQPGHWRGRPALRLQVGSVAVSIDSWATEYVDATHIYLVIPGTGVHQRAGGRWYRRRGLPPEHRLLTTPEDDVLRPALHAALRAWYPALPDLTGDDHAGVVRFILEHLGDLPPGSGPSELARVMAAAGRDDVIAALLGAPA